MNQNETYELEAQNLYQGVVTYLSNFNRYGNRHCLTVNHHKMIYMISGSNHGEYGTVYENCGVRELKQLEKEFVQAGYQHVRSQLAENYGGW